MRRRTSVQPPSPSKWCSGILKWCSNCGVSSNGTCSIPTLSLGAFPPVTLSLGLGRATPSIAYVMPFCIASNTFRISTPSPPFCALCCFVLHERHSAHILRFLLCISPLTLSAGPATLSIAYVMPFCICCNTSPISTPSPAFCALCCFVLHERHSAHILTFLLCISPLTLSAGPCHPVCCVRYAFLHFFQYISNFQPPPTVLCTVLLPAA